MSKFKVGDKVRILDGSKIENYAGGWTKKMGRYVGEIHEVSNVIHLFSDSSMYEYELDGVNYVWDERGLERCGNETIVFYRKGNEVIALDKRTGKKAITKCSTEDTFDFNIGAKLAFDRLMNGNKENITVEYMRNRLMSYCIGRSCGNCKLKYSTCRCGCGTHFMIKGSDGNYTMSDREIEDAFNIVYGTATKLYNGKIVFTKGDSIFKTGHIYEVKDGRINTDQYGLIPMEEPLKDIEDVKDYFTGKCDGNRERERGWSLYTLELMEVVED